MTTGSLTGVRQRDPVYWPDPRARLETICIMKTQAEWIALMEGCDACFAGVSSLSNAPADPHHIARGTFVTVAPRCSRTPAAIQKPDPRIGAHIESDLISWGFSREEVEGLPRSGRC